MELEGKIWKDGKDPGWLVEVPYLNVMTQGSTKEEALFMIADAIKLLMEDAFEGIKFEININYYNKDLFGVSCSDSNLLLAFALRRQRENNKITIREAAQRLGSSSPNAYARYEQGKVKPTFQKYEQLLHAVNPKRQGLFIR
jgi:predicted RNase H-like HicB family nuclease